MRSKWQLALKIACLLLALTLFAAGCGEQVITDPAYKQIVNRIDLPDDKSSEPEDTSDDIVSIPEYTDNTSSQEAEEEEEVEDYIFALSKVRNISKISATERAKPVDFMPNIAYMKGNVVYDTLFDGFSISLASNQYLDYSSPGSVRPLTKKEWNGIIYNYIFKKGYNVDALEEAAGVLKEVLHIPQYKVAVFLTYGYPGNTENFGEVNGKELHPKSSAEDCYLALKWLIDEQVKAFNERNYQNIVLCGFYYHSENFFAQEETFLPRVNDYIRSLGMKSVYSPYYHSKGWNKGRDMGFDECCMQINYFPGREDLPNAGPKSNIINAANNVRSNKMSIEMELCSYSIEASITGFKEYMLNGIKYGYMKQFHTWWMSGGLGACTALYNNVDSYFSSAYTDMYKFIKRKLTIPEIEIKE